MKQPLSQSRKRVVAIILLWIVAINALAAGYGFMADPTGGALGMTTDYLRYSPFPNYFAPGLILFVMNGILSMIAAIFAMLRSRHYQDFIFLQGMILGGWIIIQIILVRDINLMHIACLAIGYALTRLGREIKMGLSSEA